MENTLEAIEEAARVGADGVEIDVRPCRTGEIVVVHDETVARITDKRDRRSVATMTWSSLSGLGLAHGERVPRLEDVLTLAADRDLWLNIEVKRDVPSRIRATLDIARVLRGRHPLPDVVLSSFDPFMLAGLAVLAPEVPRALLVEPKHAYLKNVAGALRATALHPSHELVTAELVARCHDRGLAVNCWTVNDVTRARELATLGVDGIITDDPSTIGAAVRASGS